MPRALRDKGQALTTEIWKQAKREATQAFAKARGANETDAAKSARTASTRSG